MGTKRLLFAIVVIASLLLASCSSAYRVGALQTESKSVKLGDARSVHVNIDFGAGDMELTGGAEKLLEADFNYNVARLKPEVKYTDGTLIVRQPDVSGWPSLIGIEDFRNEWGLRLYDAVPMDLRVNMGAGTSVLKLAGLSLTGLDVTMGAGTYTIDLTGDWARDLDVTIDSGAAIIYLRLPRDVGARVVVDRGANMISAADLTQDGNVYTNAAYGASAVTMQVDLKAGIGQINLEVD